MSILHQIPSEAKMRRVLKGIIFGKTLFCPRCGSKSVKKYAKRYRCKVCRRPFSLISTTWFKSMKLPMQTFWLILWRYGNKIPICQAVNTCGVSKVTIIRWYDRFRDNLPRDKIVNVILSGTAQMDEMYRGKKEKRWAVVGANQKAKKGQKRKIALQFIPKSSVDRKDALDFLSQRIAPNSNLNTDGASIYKKIGNWWPARHTYELHRKWEFTLTSEIEGLWGNFTTFITRMYHHISFEKAPEFLNEFTARFMYPEWFSSPEDFLNISVKPIVRFHRNPGKPKIRIYKQNIFKFRLPAIQTKLASVPS